MQMGQKMVCTCVSLFISSGQQVESFCSVNVVLELNDNIQQSLLHIVKTSTPVIMLKHLSNVIDIVVRLISLFRIADM